MVQVETERNKGISPRLYVCSGDGLGSSGKTAIARSLEIHLGELLHGASVAFFKEPPQEKFAGFSPYDITTTKSLVAPEALGPYLAGIRGWMWGSSPDCPWKIPTADIVIGDRSPASSFLQRAYPGGEDPWGADFWKLLYGKFPWVPVPDILPLLFPDDIGALVNRLRERAAKGSKQDQFDDPDKQLEQFKAFQALAGVLFRYPGIYKVTTAKIRIGFEELRLVDPGFILSLLTVAFAIEKGIVGGVTEKHYLPDGVHYRRRIITRINKNNAITCYLMNLGLTGYFTEASSSDSARRMLSTNLTVRFGDIGICWPYAQNQKHSPFIVAVYALEPGAKGWETDSIHEYIRRAIKDDAVVDVTEATRYGNDLFKKRFPNIDRSWGNISW